MSTTDTLDIATGSETIDGANLQISIDALLAMAKGLTADIQDAPDVEAVQAIGRAQADLTSQAMALVTAQITLMAGEVKITADHINAAAQAAQAAVAKITDWKKKVATIGKIVDFVGVLLTGDGGKMLQAAVQLKDVF
jgi:hypothetical protein